MRVMVLGPVVVSDGTRTIRLGPRQTTLLAVLAAVAGERVSTTVLVDALWPDTAPRTAIKTLQGHVHRIRQVIGSEAIEQRHGGYALATDAVDIDARQLSALAERAHQVERLGDPDKAVALLREALELFRGRPFEDVDTDLVRIEAQRLAELRLAILEDLFEAELSGHHHREVLGELEAFVAANPWRERAAAQLMLALYRSDRQTDALAVYSRVRAHLVGELGLEPGPGLRALEVAILEHDPELAAPTALPGRSLRAHGRPVRASRDDPVAAWPAFVGRDAILAALRRRVRESFASRGSS